MKFQKLKEELKSHAVEIREIRRAFKNFQRTGVWQGPELPKTKWGTVYPGYHLKGLSEMYRLKHLAYGFLRGVPYEAMEKTVRPGNEPDMKWVEHYKEVYGASDEPPVCSSAV